MILGIVSIVVGFLLFFVSAKVPFLLVISMTLWSLLAISLCLITSGVLAIINKYKPNPNLLYTCAILNAIVFVVCLFCHASDLLLIFYFLPFAYYMARCWQVRRVAERDEEKAPDERA